MNLSRRLADGRLLINEAASTHESAAVNPVYEIFYRKINSKLKYCSGPLYICREVNVVYFIDDLVPALINSIYFNYLFNLLTLNHHNF
jgi:hypothetical protein